MVEPADGILVYIRCWWVQAADSKSKIVLQTFLTQSSTHLVFFFSALLKMSNETNT